MDLQSSARLAIVTTHPIQYNAPVFQELARRKKIVVKVFYTNGVSAKDGKFDRDFGRQIKWDLPLTDGYDHCFVENIAKDPGSHHYKGIDNPTLIKEITEWGASGVLFFGWKFKAHLGAIRYFSGKIPVLFRGDSTLLDEQKGVRQLLRRQLLRWVYRHVDIALYAGMHNKAYFIAHGLKDKNLIFAPHAIDNDRFLHWDQYRQSELDRMKLELGINREDFVILFAGKFIAKKNPEFLVKLGDALREYERIKVLMVGNGVLESGLKEQVKENKRFLFMDFQNQTLMPVVYRLGSVFVLPSVGPGETWGLALNEAMACGLPVVATAKCGGAPDLIEEGVNGVVADPADVLPVRNFIMSLCHNEQLREMSGRASAERIKNFNFATVAAAIESAIRRY